MRSFSCSAETREGVRNYGLNLDPGAEQGTARWTDSTRRFGAVSIGPPKFDPESVTFTMIADRDLGEFVAIDRVSLRFFIVGTVSGLAIEIGRGSCKEMRAPKLVF